MHCRSRSASRPVASSLDARHVDPAVRVGDADREEVAALLGDATAGGFLGVEELEGRLTQVWSAATWGELSAASADLPPQLHRARAPSSPVPPALRLIGAGRSPHLASYVGVMALLVLIWLLAGLNGSGWYPWPVWPALGWGIGLVSHGVAAKPAR